MRRLVMRRRGLPELTHCDAQVCGGAPGRGVDAVLKSVTLAECQELARIALDAATAEDARSAVRAKLPILEELGL